MGRHLFRLTPRLIESLHPPNTIGDNLFSMMPKLKDKNYRDPTGLYLVYLKGATDPDQIHAVTEAFHLNDYLYLARSDQPQSKLYHAIKHQTNPKSLLLADLAAHPKFKGMTEGSLKWLRAPEWNTPVTSPNPE